MNRFFRWEILQIYSMKLWHRLQWKRHKTCFDVFFLLCCFTVTDENLGIKVSFSWWFIWATFRPSGMDYQSNVELFNSPQPGLKSRDMSEYKKTRIY
jgi:hypothetical protein